MSTDIAYLGAGSGFSGLGVTSNQDDAGSDSFDEEGLSGRGGRGLLIAVELKQLLAMFRAHDVLEKKFVRSKKLYAALEGKADASKPFRFTNKVEDEDWVPYRTVIMEHMPEIKDISDICVDKVAACLREKLGCDVEIVKAVGDIIGQQLREAEATGN